jgi:hypothetical protein
MDGLAQSNIEGIVAPHGGFTDPNTPANAPPRESIEVRMVVFFPPGV